MTERRGRRPRQGRRRLISRRSDRGAGTLLAVWVAMALMGAGVIGVLWAVVSVGTHRVAAAADLAALSAAQAVQAGETEPCMSARRIAAEQQVELRSCEVDGEIVAVEAATALRLGALGSALVSAEARAGPAGGEPNEGDQTVIGEGRVERGQ